MHVAKIWRVLCVLGFMGTSLCVNEAEYEGNYAEDYYNEISQNQQGGEFGLFILLSLLFNRWLMINTCLTPLSQ